MKISNFDIKFIGQGVLDQLDVDPIELIQNGIKPGLWESDNPSFYLRNLS